MKKIRVKIVMFIINMANRFCFCNHHDDNCNGCVFKNCDTCPVETFVNKLYNKFIKED